MVLGNSFSDQDRVVATGYENGDVKIFDLKTMSIMYETNLKNGVNSVLLFQIHYLIGLSS